MRSCVLFVNQIKPYIKRCWDRLCSFWTTPCDLCLGPSANAIRICDQCLGDLPYMDCACKQCGLPLSESAITSICGQCQLKKPIVNQVIVGAQYRFPVDKMVARLKYQGKLPLARALGYLICESLDRQIKGQRLPDYLIPVPLSKQRLIERGFNQSLEIAKVVSAHTSIPIGNGWCERVTHTPFQVKLDALARRKNMKGAFKCKNLGGLHVAIIDDVMTTGSTSSELAGVLLAAGASKVDVWCCARAC